MSDSAGFEAGARDGGSDTSTVSRMGERGVLPSIAAVEDKWPPVRVGRTVLHIVELFVAPSEYPPGIAEICRWTRRGEVVRGIDPADWAVAVELALAGDRASAPDLPDRAVEPWRGLIEGLL